MNLVTSKYEKLPVDKNETYRCDHYKRKCKFFTPCCNKSYRCRFCHDSSEKHTLRREDVSHIVCCDCGTKQTLSGECVECGTLFGRYFCLECKLYDDDKKEQFHCSGCGICRIGGRENFFHCEICDMCLPSHLDNGRHRCIENLSKSNCPICLEDIHTSREPSQIPPCNHLIHKSCFDQLVSNGHFNCPLCQASLVDMTDMWVLYDEQIKHSPLPEPYKDIYCQMHCQDCLKSDKSIYHIVGIKCTSCGGYNTVREKGPYYRKQGENFVEIDFASQMSSSVSRVVENGILNVTRVENRAPPVIESIVVETPQNINDISLVNVENSEIPIAQQQVPQHEQEAEIVQEGSEETAPRSVKPKRRIQHITNLDWDTITPRT